MHQNYGKFDRAERLTQYLIETFDLVEIIPASSTRRSTRHRLIQSDASPAARYGETQNVIPCVGAAHGGGQC